MLKNVLRPMTAGCSSRRGHLPIIGFYLLRRPRPRAGGNFLFQGGVLLQIYGATPIIFKIDIDEN